MKKPLLKAQVFLQRFWRTFSFTGLLCATFFFAASVTPSLIPRIDIVQGVLSGFSLAIGYGLGVALTGIWKFLEIPPPSNSVERWCKRGATLSAGFILVFFVWKCTDWQNSIRMRMEMPPLERSFPLGFFLIATVVALLLVVSVRATVNGVHLLSTRLARFVPWRLSVLISAVLVILSITLVTNDLIARQLLRVADRFFLKTNNLIDSGIQQPLDPMACGSADSLIQWNMIGRRGKTFIAGGPTREAISKVTGRITKQPIRVYAGMGETEEDSIKQAQIALEELKRVGGFDRKVLIIATPTGTGWLDEAAVDTVEYLHLGDTAIVSTQYSYLPSWLTILVDPDRSIQSGQILFDLVYRHWTTLEKDNRPKLYLFGLSLGSLGCEQAADLLHTFQDPIQGAVWSGPPFPSSQWSSVVRARNPESSVWAPTFDDESMIRFTTQQNQIDTNKAWGPMRNVYIQYSSDPMVWFSPKLAWQRPGWLDDPRAPDVSPKLEWYPIITMLQIGFDLPLATNVPIGYGHNYSPSSYIDAWEAVTEPSGWTKQNLDELKKLFADAAAN